VNKRRYGWRDVWRDLVPLLALLLVGFAYFSDTPTTSDLRRVEIRDRDTGRATAYRLCTRNKVDRAFAHGRIRGIAVRGEPSQVPGIPTLEHKARIRLSRLLMHAPFLPILDCNPNLRGFGAKPLPIPEQERFLRRWSQRQIPPAEIGVCPHSAIGDAIAPDRC
jgi:hypothetical protein